MGWGGYNQCANKQPNNHPIIVPLQISLLNLLDFLKSGDWQLVTKLFVEQPLALPGSANYLMFSKIKKIYIKYIEQHLWIFWTLLSCQMFGELILTLAVHSDIFLDIVELFDSKMKMSLNWIIFKLKKNTQMLWIFIHLKL